MTRAPRLAIAAVLLYVGVLSLRPLHAYDLFWHLAAGRQILATGEVPRHDSFSFTSEGAPWIDHEWLWQLLAQGLYGLASGGRGPRPDPAGCLALILSGVVVVGLAFLPALARLARDGVAPAAIVALGLLAAETSRERLMVRPETASLLLLAGLLVLLGRGSPGLRRGLLIGSLVALWANIHPAALLVPGLVFLHELGRRLGSRGGEAPANLTDRAVTRTGRLSGIGGRASVSGSSAWLAGVAIEVGLATIGTLANPWGASLWKVPLELSSLVRSKNYSNPEWLPPDPLSYPFFWFFWVCASVTVAGALLAMIRWRRLPSGPTLVALVMALMTARQMRHMGLFAVAFLFAGSDLIRALVPRSSRSAGEIGEVLRRPSISLASLAGALVVAATVLIDQGPSILREGGLDPGRFPVDACEAIAREAPGLRLYNDVRFGGYLIWRFHHRQKVFIDGRNEIYPDLLARLGRLHSGEAPYEEWRAMIREFSIDGAVVQYNDDLVGVEYAPSRPGEPPRRGFRAVSAYLFPPSEWALVYFDDTALVFMRRGGQGGGWIAKGEYRVLNPEDRRFLLEQAGENHDFARSLRVEAGRRVTEKPPSLRALALLEELGSPVDHPPSPDPTASP